MAGARGDLLVSHDAEKRIFLRRPAPASRLERGTVTSQCAAAPPHTGDWSAQQAGYVQVLGRAEETIFLRLPGVGSLERGGSNNEQTPSRGDGRGLTPNARADLPVRS